jgi:hypothetical protein
LNSAFSLIAGRRAGPRSPGDTPPGCTRMSSNCFATKARGSFITATALVLAGCGGQQSAEQALAKSLGQAGQRRQQVFPLAGHVSVDGAPPAYDLRCPVIVVLIEREKTAEPGRSHRFVECDPDGRFSFSTYARDDGVSPGRYVVAIAKLPRTAPRRYAGPDRFGNRYNDPDKNAREAEFQIEHQAPGRTDYDFRLTVEPVETPGPHALTAIP